MAVHQACKKTACGVSPCRSYISSCYIFTYSGSAQVLFFEIRLISKEINWAEPEELECMHTPPDPKLSPEGRKDATLFHSKVFLM